MELRHASLATEYVTCFLTSESPRELWRLACLSWGHMRGLTCYLQ